MTLKLQHQIQTKKNVMGSSLFGCRTPRTVHAIWLLVTCLQTLQSSVLQRQPPCASLFRSHQSLLATYLHSSVQTASMRVYHTFIHKPISFSSVRLSSPRTINTKHRKKLENPIYHQQPLAIFCDPHSLQFLFIFLSQPLSSRLHCPHGSRHHFHAWAK